MHCELLLEELIKQESHSALTVGKKHETLERQIMIKSLIHEIYQRLSLELSPTFISKIVTSILELAGAPMDERHIITLAKEIQEEIISNNNYRPVLAAYLKSNPLAAQKFNREWANSILFA